MISVSTDPSEEDIRALAANMRMCDRREVFASSGEDPVTALFASVRDSDGIFMFYLDDAPVAIAGVAPITASIGAPWLLCADSVSEVPKALFWRTCKVVIEEFSSHYAVLTNYIDARNTVSRGWLRHLGFQEKETVNYGFLKKPFIRFEK